MKNSHQEEHSPQANAVRAADRYVAARIRARRKELGLTQQQLAGKIGLSYQQVQKYETGANRIGAGRLHALGQAMLVRPSYFYEGLEATASGKSGSVPAEINDAIMNLVDALES